MFNKCQEIFILQNEIYVSLLLRHVIIINVIDTVANFNPTCRSIRIYISFIHVINNKVM